MNKFPFFPIPRAGETVFSAFCRCIVRSGIKETFLINEFTGQIRKTTLLSPLPGYLARISSKMPNGHPWCNPRIIVRDHTLMPYFTYFVDEENRELITSSLSTYESSLPVTMKLGLPQFRCRASTNHPRYCNVCIKEDRINIGFSFYKREHQLPGVGVCWKHGENLAHGCKLCGTYPIKQKAMSLPGWCLCEKGPIPLQAFTKIPSNNTILKWLATESKYIVESKGTNSVNPRKHIKELLVARGISRGKMLNYEILAESLEKRYGKEVLGWLKMPAYCDERPSAWVRRSLGATGIKKSPTINYLLLIGLVCSSVKKFEKMINDDGSLNLSPKSNDNQLYDDIKQSPPDWLDKFITLVETCDKGLPFISQQLDVKTSKLVSVARQFKIRVPLSNFTRNYLGESLIESIRKDLITGIDKIKIIEKWKISEWSLSLIELDEPQLSEDHKIAAKQIIRDKHRQRLLDYLSENPDAHRSDILNNLSGVYDYMLNSDKEWFYENAPESNRKYNQPSINKNSIWEELDKTKAYDIKSFVESELSPDRKPIQLTESRILKAVNISAKYRNNISRFPLVKHEIENNIESYDDYIVRKLKWAVLKVINDGKEITANNVRLLAGVQCSVIRDKKHIIFKYGIENGGIFSNLSIFAGM